MTTLSERARILVDMAGSVTALANIAGIRPPSISDWLNGKTKSIKGPPAARITKHFDLNPVWVTDGIGAMRSSLLPSSDTQASSLKAESPVAQYGYSAMLLKFPKLSPTVIDADDYYVIRQYATGGAMGHGLTLADQPGVIENWSVSKEWLNKNIRTHSGVKNLCIVTGFGPSMQPMFNPGDPLLVDVGVNSVIADGVYFFRVGSEGFIKQLQKIPTETGVKYVAKSKNPDYDNFEITDKMDFEVLGRVIRVWCGTDF